MAAEEAETTKLCAGFFHKPGLPGHPCQTTAICSQRCGILYTLVCLPAHTLAVSDVSPASPVKLGMPDAAVSRPSMYRRAGHSHRHSGAPDINNRAESCCPPPLSSRLLSDTQLLDQRTISFQIGFLQICKKTTSLTYHHQQTTSGMMVLRIDL